MKDTVGTNITFGLPTDEAVKVCKFRYTHELAKVSVYISDPTVMSIKKDVKSTFSDQLGVVGTPNTL